jgi:hypothetical protein
VFSKIRLEKHGDAALQDSWAFAELDNFVPSRKERVIEEYFGEDQRVGEICPLAAQSNPGRYLKIHHGEAGEDQVCEEAKVEEVDVKVATSSGF